MGIDPHEGVPEHTGYVDRGVLGGQHEGEPPKELVELLVLPLTEATADHVEYVGDVLLLPHALELLQFLLHLLILFTLHLTLLELEVELYLSYKDRPLALVGQHSLHEGGLGYGAQLAPIINFHQGFRVLNQDVWQGEGYHAIPFCQIKSLTLCFLLGWTVFVVFN
jgi:hypothetical protein